MMPLMETIRAYLGWCPAEGQMHRQMQPGPGMRGDTPHDGRRRVGGINMEIDFIVKEELWRSTAVFWILVLITAFVITTGYLPIPAFLLFPLPLAITAVIFYVVVWYRRKEHLIDPNPLSILRHALGSRNREKKTKRRGTVIEKMIDVYQPDLLASRPYRHWPVPDTHCLHRRWCSTRHRCALSCLLPHSSHDLSSALPSIGVSHCPPSPGNRAYWCRFFSHPLHLGTATHTGGNRLMITLGAMEQFCTPVREIFGVEISSEPTLREMVADRQRIREMML